MPKKSQIRVDEPTEITEEVFGTDFTSQEAIMDYAYAIHKDDYLNFIAEVREICFRSKIDYSLDELSAYFNKKTGD